MQQICCDDFNKWQKYLTRFPLRRNPFFILFVLLYFISFISSQIAPYCSESDDFNDEAREVYKDQGAALPYSKGFHLICQLVAAMNPDDLDAMDESIPFTKFTLDNLLGIVSNDASYQHYFDSFIEAQQKRVVEIDERTGQPSQLDLIRKNTQWDFEQFRTTNGPAKLIAQVNDVKRQLQQAAN